MNRTDIKQRVHELIIRLVMMDLQDHESVNLCIAARHIVDHVSIVDVAISEATRLLNQVDEFIQQEVKRRNTVVRVFDCVDSVNVKIVDSI